jgi:hypothetical protein
VGKVGGVKRNNWNWSNPFPSLALPPLLLLYTSCLFNFPISVILGSASFAGLRPWVPLRFPQCHQTPARLMAPLCLFLTLLEGQRSRSQTWGTPAKRRILRSFSGGI